MVLEILARRHRTNTDLLEDAVRFDLLVVHVHPAIARSIPVTFELPAVSLRDLPDEVEELQHCVRHGAMLCHL
jgi:hypothetical protein